MKKIFLCALCVFSLSSLSFASAKINTVNGGVTINGVSAVPGQQLNPNDIVKTSTKSSAVVLINGHKVSISEKTQGKLLEITDNTSVFVVLVGKIRALVKKLQVRQKFEVKTPTAICAVRGTDFAVDVADDSKTRLEVYEGVVAVKEETTGSEVFVNPGEFTTIQKGEAPKEPEKMDNGKTGEKSEEQKDDIKSEAQREIFMEISRESVMGRAAEEIKLAEYQNGKALVDVSGNRVRLEEYVYRPAENKNQFKYVVLNERENRFDFGKILFTFNKELPANLNDVTKNMFHSEGSTAPEWYITNLDSVMSNTYDKILEEASGGKMIPDDSLSATEWNLFLPNYKFYIGNADSTENSGKGKLMWQFVDNGDNKSQADEFTFLPGTAYESHTDPAVSTFKMMPDGNTAFHFAYRDVYGDGTWIEKHNYIIDDNGKVQTFTDIVDTANISADKIKEKILTLNFENVYTSSLFSAKYDQKIDLIFSSKLLSDSGILSLPSSLSQSPKIE
ncbi:MAG: FecR family protein [Elusimicrobia bacterium]|nr:FecR family protein [Elusimicrobiota bacterium]